MQQSEFRSSHLDFVDLRLFVNIVDAGSLTMAAARSCLSLGAVSMRIKRMEDRLGVLLLSRSNTGISPTLAGRSLAEQARQVLRQMHSLENAMQAYSQATDCDIRMLTTTTTATSDILVNDVAQYLALHPHVNIFIEEESSSNIVTALHNGDVDIGIISSMINWNGLYALPYKKNQHVIITARGHPLANQGPIEFADTLDYEFVGLSHSTVQQAMEKYARTRGRLLKVRSQVSNIETMCRFVEKNIGIGIMPSSMAMQHAESMEISVVSLFGDWARAFDLMLCVRSLEELTPGTHELFTFLTTSPPVDIEPVIPAVAAS